MKNSNKGFTLIEVLVAMGIVMLIAMAFFSINNMSIKVNDKNEKNIQSMNIAQSVMEDVRGYIKEGTGISYEIDLNEGSNWTIGNKYNKDITSTQNIGSTIYNTDVKIERQKIGSRYLYTVTVNVSAPNSNKNTKLITQIFEM
jgi:prepilin-type N-terminal cleavage/methylation domain-containing protein